MAAMSGQDKAVAIAILVIILVESTRFVLPKVDKGYDPRDKIPSDWSIDEDCQDGD